MTADLPQPTEDDLAYVAKALPVIPGDPAEIRYLIAALLAGERAMYRDTINKLAAQVEARIIARPNDHQVAALARNVPKMLRAVTEAMA